MEKQQTESWEAKGHLDIQAVRVKIALKKMFCLETLREINEKL